MEFRILGPLAGVGDDGADPGGARCFLVELLGYMPSVTHRWAGIFGLTQDLLPLVGPIPARDGVWVGAGAGYSGHGNVLGFLCGELVAAALLDGDDPLLELFSPARLQLEAS